MRAAITAASAAASAAALLVCLAAGATMAMAQPKDRAAPAVPAPAQPQTVEPAAAPAPPAAGCRLIWHKSNPSAGGNMSGINVTANSGGEPIPLEAVGCQSTGVSIEVK